MDPTANPKMKTTKGKGVGACFLARNISGLEGCVEVSRWGLRRLINNLITHTNLHKPNNKLLSG